MIFWIWLTTAIVALVLYLRQFQARFKDYGVRFINPLPILGNMANILFRREHFSENIQKHYNAFPEDRFIGKFEFLRKTIVIRDLELLKKVTVKDFEHFLDRNVFFDREIDKIFGRHLLSLRGQEWKDMRSTLSPAFTSSKIKQMLPFMVEVCDNMIMALKNKIKTSGRNYVDIDVKDLTTRFTNDVIATCAFGLKVDSHNEEQNTFYTMGRTALDIKFVRILKLSVFNLFPSLRKAFDASVFPPEPRNFFRNIFMDTMRDREVRHIIRPDMIHLLMEAKKGKLTRDEKDTNDADAGFATVDESEVGKKATRTDWSDDDLVAQAVLFFAAGFETVSSALSFLLHELALHPDIQEKLVQEIKAADAKNGGKFEYSTIQHMPYMDMVISEVLRLWPPAQITDRLCIKDYNLGKANDTAPRDYIIRKGEGIQIPVFAFHRNPDYFPNPTKFDPERFSEENKHKIKPFTYIPFGSGPRNCIGSRFALCEMKVVVYHLLKSMEVCPCEKTQVKPILAKENVNYRIVGGQWVRMRVRN